jgi:hypothetical protein
VLLPRRLAQFVIGLVSVVWFVNFGAQFVPALNWHPDASINGIFMGVVGGALVLSRKADKHDEGDDDEGDDGGDGDDPEPPTPPTPPEMPPELAAVWKAFLDSQSGGRAVGTTSPPARRRHAAPRRRDPRGGAR